MTPAQTPARILSWGLFALVAGAVVVGHVATGHAQTAASPPPATPAPQAVVNPCLGVEEAKCGTVQGCVWLPGYKVKDAPDVVGYCRTAPKPLTARRPGDAAPAVKQ